MRMSYHLCARLCAVCGGLWRSHAMCGGLRHQSEKVKERSVPYGPRQTRWGSHVRVGLPRASGRPYGCSPHVGSIQSCTMLCAPRGLEVEDGGERRAGAGVRRAGEGGMHSTVVLAGGGEGDVSVTSDVTDAGAAATPVSSEGRGPRQMLP